MRFAVSAVTLLVASTTLALEDPHRKTVRPIKVDHGHLKSRATTVADDGDYQYLNKKTKSEFNPPTGLSV